MATAYYPAVIERAGDTFSVYFPDLPGCTSAGTTEQEAAQNASEALAAHLVELAHHKEDVPNPSTLDAIGHDPDVDEVARLLVSAELPGKAVRINVTMDEGLIAAIDKVARNRSGFIADAARDRLRAFA